MSSTYYIGVTSSKAGSGCPGGGRWWDCRHPRRKCWTIPPTHRGPTGVRVRDMLHTGLPAPASRGPSSPTPKSPFPPLFFTKFSFSGLGTFIVAGRSGCWLDGLPPWRGQNCALTVILCFQLFITFQPINF